MGLVNQQKVFCPAPRSLKALNLRFVDARWLFFIAFPLFWPKPLLKGRLSFRSSLRSSLPICPFHAGLQESSHSILSGLFLLSGLWNDMLEFHYESLQWRDLSPGASGDFPPPTADHGFASVESRGLLYVFGCEFQTEDNAGLSNKLFEFNVQQLLWTDLSALSS
eukprot:1039206-Rhodomonas_salina.1